MQNQQNHIALISDENESLSELFAFLSDPQNNIIHFSFDEALQDGLSRRSYDLVILYCLNKDGFNFSHLNAIRLQKLEFVPFIFILDSKQEKIKRQFYRNPLNLLIYEPVERYAFVSVVFSALHLANLESRIHLYQNIVEGEKQLISYMDKLLNFPAIYRIDNEDELYKYLQKNLISKIELTLAVETALFALYDKESNLLIINVYDESGRELVRRHALTVTGTYVSRLINQNIPHIFEKEQLRDPLAQALEESLGIKIFGMLFSPVSVFHECRGAFILINKLYRNEFSENDLSFCLIAAQKIVFHLEELLLSGKSATAMTKPQLQDTHSEAVFFKECNLYKQILDSVSFGIIIFDQSEAVELVNPAAIRIMGKEEAQIRKLADLFDDDELRQIKQVVENEDPPIIRREMQIKKVNVPNCFIGFSIYPFQDDDKSIFIFSEISQTKRIQAEIIRMDRMASLGILSSGIAHEIRNPLAGIKAMAQTLQEELEENAAHYEYAERITRQVNRLDDLLKSFFTYAKPVRPDPSASHIKKIIQEVIMLFKRKMHEQNIEIKEFYARDLDKVFVDANQIQQVFLNLFINAMDAMSGGGTINISARNALQPQPFVDRRKRAPALLSERYIEIQVSDTGAGIPTEALEQIFDPFFTTKTNGTGLGLSIVYQIVKEHGGQIEVQSEAGNGTIFFILLPALERKNDEEDALIH